MEELKQAKIFKLRKTAIIMGMVFLAVFLIFPVLAAAPELNVGLEYVDYTGLANTDIRMIIAKIIRVALGLVGLIAVGFTIYGGYMYMTSEGNEEKVATAKKILKNMVIGLAIILSALAIVQFIISAIYSEYEARYGGEEPGVFTEEFVVGGYLGHVIESHYPKRNAPWPGEPLIPRNTKIVVTFREKIKPDTLITDANGDGIFGNVIEKEGVKVSDQINFGNIKIYATAETESASLPANKVNAYLSADGRTVVFKPTEFIGHYLKDTNYTVKLGSGVKLFNNTPAFSGVNPNYYWQFTVSPLVDLTPPQVESIIPLPSSREYKRNIIIQINFNEAIDPISASGFFKTNDSSKNFQNIKVAKQNSQLVSGEFKITNQYRTIEFITDDQCGVNPCGQPIFCLPAQETVTTTVKAAAIDTTNPPQAMIGANLYDGVVDMANNSLDGGGELKLVGDEIILPPHKDGKAEGPPKDNFFWSFKTSETLDTTAPKISAISPGSETEGVAPNAPLSITFDKPMSISSFSNIILKTNKNFNVWYTSSGLNLKANGQPVTALNETTSYSLAQILHGDFWQKPVGSAESNAIYYPFAPSEVSDIYQNCFYQAVGPGAECVAGSGADKLNDDNPSCYDREATAGASLCGAGETCPFGPALKP